MATLKPFLCIRPKGEYVKEIAALPYDVYSRKEAKEYVKDKKLSFLNIDRPETGFEEEMDMYSKEVYQYAHDRLWEMIHQGYFMQEESQCYYLYGLDFKGRSQYGFVGLASVEEYLDGRIRKHEKTREDKERDRIEHIKTCKAQTGPIFLAYRHQQQLSNLQKEIIAEKPIYDFMAEDGVAHRVWRIEDKEKIAQIELGFKKIERLYIADGHHRAASAVKASMEESFVPYFLGIAFDQSQLEIMDYNRVVEVGHLEDKESVLDKVFSRLIVTEEGDKPFELSHKGEVNVYYQGIWYKALLPKVKGADSIEKLDVAILQNSILEPIFGIADPRTDQRIQFVGGIRGYEGLASVAEEVGGMAFGMYPTSMEELFEVADANLLMPPKSTWFEPKLRSGIFIHDLS